MKLRILTLFPALLLAVSLAPIYRTTGPPLGAPFTPETVTETVVGSAGLYFRDSQNADFFYNIEGSGWVTKRITRLPIE